MIAVWSGYAPLLPGFAWYTPEGCPAHIARYPLSVITRLCLAYTGRDLPFICISHLCSAVARLCLAYTGRDLLFIYISHLCSTVARLCLACTGRDSLQYGCHQFLNWWLHHATGMMHLIFRVPFRAAKKQIPKWVSAFLVHRKGLEPPTLGTGIRCSIH